MTARAVLVFVLGVIFALIGIAWTVGKLADLKFKLSGSQNDEGKEDVCEGHHFEESYRTSVEVGEKNWPHKSVVLAHIEEECQHEGCDRLSHSWEIEEFRTDEIRGNFHIERSVREKIDEMTDGELSRYYIEDEAKREINKIKENWGGSKLVERGSNGHERD